MFYITQRFPRSKVSALRASYKISLRIAKAKKPYIIGEQLLVGCIKDAHEERLVKLVAKKAAKFCHY